MPTSAKGTSIITTATAQLQSNQSNSHPNAVPSGRQCSSCGSLKIINEPETASIVCMDCGVVNSENLLDDGSWFVPYGKTHVNSDGRALVKPLGPRDKRHAVIKGDPTTITHRVYKFRPRLHMKMMEHGRNIIMSVGRVNGFSQVSTKRAVFLFSLIRDIMTGNTWKAKALACLYISGRESGKNLRLIELASQAELSPFKLGSEYRKIRTLFIQRNTIDPGVGLYDVEEDPWVELERILLVGNSESIERGDFERLSQDVKDALGINMEYKERSRRLRSLLSMAQKFMIIATNASLDIARRIQPLVAACFVAVLEVRLQITQPPPELLQWVQGIYNSSPSTIMHRYQELKKCIIEWARRLPFVNKKERISEKKFIYYAEDVLKYFGHLQDKNRELWNLLDRSIEEEECEGIDNQTEEMSDDIGCDVEDVSNNGKDKDDYQDTANYTHQGYDNYDDAGRSTVELDYNNQIPLTNEEILASVTRRSFDPPAYTASVKRHQRLVELIQCAKSSIANPLVPTPIMNPRDSRRFEWIKQLLTLGTRTEAEILSVSDNCLADWMQSDMSRETNPAAVRSQEELDSIELTTKDMDNEELQNYIRLEPTKETMEQFEDWCQEEEKRAVKQEKTQQSFKQATRKKQQRKRTWNEVPLDKDDSSGRGGRRIRSRKLRIEALTESDNEIESAQSLPRPGQRIIHPSQDRSLTGDEAQKNDIMSTVIGNSYLSDEDTAYFENEDYDELQGYDDYPRYNYNSD
ncbi:hypothetical protein FBU30_009941 [Linnemannia zychae]|nr:hypothetical protein FBU30_009941 [Linnemannia zychae]